MIHLKIENKKYFILPEENYYALQKTAALKTKSDPILTIKSAKAYTKNLIRKESKKS